MKNMGNPILWPERAEQLNPVFLDDVADKIAGVIDDESFTATDARAIINETIADHYRNRTGAA